MMGDITELDEHRPHEFWEAMCVKCLERWIAVVPVGMLLKKVECKNCGPGYVVNTGQDVSG